MVQSKISHDRLVQEHGRSPEPEMIKRPRPSRLPQPGTPEKQIVAKVTERSTNYMKGTSSSVARRQSQGVQVGSDKKIQTGKKLDSCYGSKKKQSSSSSSSNHSGKTVKKGLSFKRSFGDVNAHRGTCSSYLKNSNFPEYMLLTSPDGLKLCSYKYCSLNVHLPLKTCISARRCSLKSQTSMKMSDLVDVYVDEKHQNGSTREVDIRVNDFESEDMNVECGEGEDQDMRGGGLGSEGAEMVSLQEGEAVVKSKEVSCSDENIGMMIDKFANLEQLENASEDQMSNKGSISDNSISFLLSEQPIIQDDIIHCLLGNALDEKLVSKEAKDWKDTDGEKAEERTELVPKAEETQSILARKPCNREECIEEWREVNPRERSYLPVFEEPSYEKVELKHRDIDDRKNPEEWMTDYALPKTVSKLALTRKKKVALLIEAYETIKNLHQLTLKACESKKDEPTLFIKMNDCNLYLQ